MTLILFPPLQHLRSLAYVTPLAVARAIETFTAQKGVPVQAEIKWPNDVLVGGKKLAGALIETEHAPERLPGRGIKRVEPDRLAQMRERLLELSRLVVLEAQRIAQQRAVARRAEQLF